MVHDDSIEPTLWPPPSQLPRHIESHGGRPRLVWRLARLQPRPPPKQQCVIGLTTAVTSLPHEASWIYSIGKADEVNSDPPDLKFHPRQKVVCCTEGRAPWQQLAGHFVIQRRM